MQKRFDKFGDIILSLSVGAQQLLLSLQLLMGGLMFDSEGVARYRIVASAIIVLLSFLWIVKRKLKMLLLSYFVVLMFFLWSIIITPGLSVYIMDEGVKFTCLTCTPILLAIMSIKDMRIFHNTFLIICIITSLIGIFYCYLLFVGYIIQETYNMGFGYSLMMPVLYFFYTKKPLLILLAIFTTVCILINGSRGPSIIIAIYAFYLAFQKLTIKKIIFLVLCSGIIFLIFLNIETFLSFLSNHGIRARTLLKLLDNDIVTSTARDNIYDMGMNSIWKSPLYGYGVFGDRLTYEPYIHNIILEILIDFGIPLGSLLMLFVLFKIYIKYVKSKGEERNFFVLLVFGSIMPLMASSSYLIDFRFFFLLGVLFSPLKRKFVIS